MTDRVPDSDLGRRLPWLLVFRAAVATALLALTLVADVSDSPLRRISLLLYGVVIGTFLVVVVLGLLLRANTSPVIVSAVHLTTAAMAALMVVHGTGGVESGLSFLYLLVILDGAIIGGRQVSLVMASASSLAYSGQLAGQLYGLLPSPAEVSSPASGYVTAAVVHVAAFYLVALLAGYLADLVRRARELASTAERGLRRVERLQKEVLESLPIGVITFDADSTVLTANARAAAILGGSKGLVGAPLPPVLSSFVASGDSYLDAEVEFDGRARQLSVSRSPVTVGGDPLGAALSVLVVEDRTALRALERDLDARKRLASLGELAAAIAHEIRNPLAAISGAVELLTSDPTDSATRGKLREIVLREIDRLNQLVGDFLVYARPTPPRRIVVDLTALAEEVCEVLSRDAAWSRYALRVVTTESIEAMVDPRQVRQVLWNLLRNALEASGESGVVEVIVQRTGGDLILEVVDYGEGISEEIRQHMFEPFRTTKRSGTGLGLAVVHRIVEAHDAIVEIQSKLGKGTRVRIVFPSAAVAARPLAIVGERG